MELNMNDIKDLTSIPKEYIYDSKTIEYLYQSNPNVFNSVNEYLNLSFEFQEKITQLINNGTIVLTKNNVKLLDSLFSEYVIDILENNFNYLYLINQNNFNGVGIVRDDDFLNLLEEHQIKITDETPYLVTLCSDYIIKQYINEKVDITNVLPYFINWYADPQRTLIQEYIKKGNSDLSIFYKRDYENNDNIIPFFENIIIEKNENSVKVKSNNVNSIISLLNFELPYHIEDIYLSDNRMSDTELLHLLEKINEENINLHIKNGLSISSNLEKNCEFLELCGNVGNIELNPFDLEEFKKLLLKVAEHPGVVINVKLDDIMEYENFFLNLNIETPINIISQKNVSILPLNEMKELNLRLDYTVSEIKNSSLSPYEKYIAAYNIVKSFKKYRFYLDNEGFDTMISDQSRNPYLVLINQYIVCAGYTSLLHSLLKKLNIPSREWILDVSDNSESVALGDSESNDTHARLYVNIVDNKYGINGYFMCDPTFDNVDKENSDLYGYRHLSMSCGESHDYGKSSSSYFYFAYDTDAFNDQMFINTDDYLSKTDDMTEIFDIVKDLDPDFYVQLSKLESIEKQKETIKKHFRDKTYRAISLETKYKAIISVLEFQNKKEFNDEEKQMISEKLYNIDRGIEEAPIIPISSNEDSNEWIDFESSTPIITFSTNGEPDDWIEFEDSTISNNKKR